MLLCMLLSRGTCRMPKGEFPDPFHRDPEGFEHAMDLVEASDGLPRSLSKRRRESSV
jgi:hypothetical protein